MPPFRRRSVRVYLDRQPPAVRSEFRAMIALKLGRKWLARARKRLEQRARAEASAVLSGADQGLLDGIALALPARHRHLQLPPPLPSPRFQQPVVLPVSAGVIATPQSVGSALLWNGLRARVDAFEAAMATGRAAHGSSAPSGVVGGNVDLSVIVSRSVYKEWARDSESRLATSVSPRLAIAEAPQVAASPRPGYGSGAGGGGSTSPRTLSTALGAMTLLTARSMGQAAMSATLVRIAAGGDRDVDGPDDGVVGGGGARLVASPRSVSLSHDERVASLTFREVRCWGGPCALRAALRPAAAPAQMNRFYAPDGMDEEGRLLEQV